MDIDSIYNLIQVIICLNSTSGVLIRLSWMENKTHFVYKSLVNLFIYTNNNLKRATQGKTIDFLKEKSTS